MMEVKRLRAEAVEAVNEAAGSLPRARLLVVDDDRLVGRAIARILSPPHDVHVVESAEAALALLGAGPAFDLVLCDLMMPGMTGVELYERTVAIAPAMASRIAFLTGGAFTPQAREFVRRVSTPCLEKPVGALALRTIVADLLRRG
jgi:CheY-like chemotaxis protein